MLTTLSDDSGGIMPSITTETTKPRASSDTRKVIGWQSPLFPFGTRSSDGRMINRPSGGVRVRNLPVGMKWQRIATEGHDQATTGLATLTKTWDTDGEFWGSGPIDIEDPEGALLARKIENGYVNLVSVDLADWTAAVRQIDGQSVEVLTDYELISATFLNDAAYGQARVFPVYDDEPGSIVPNSEVLAQRRKEAGLFSAGTVMTFNDRATVITLTAAPAHFTVEGDTGLPWAPRDRPWDQQAASDRVWAWADGDTSKLAKAHLWRDPDADPATKAAYSLPFADVIDGRLTAVFAGVSAAAGRLNQTGISAADKEKVAARIKDLYAAANKALGPSKGGPDQGPPISIPPKVKDMSSDNATTDTGMPDQVAELAEAEAADSTTKLADALTERLVDKLADAVVSRLAPADGNVEAATAPKKGVMPPQFIKPSDDDEDDEQDCDDPDLSEDEAKACRDRKTKARAEAAGNRMRAAAALNRMGVA